MYDDTASIVTVERYIKRGTKVRKTTGEAFPYVLTLDWGLGTVDWNAEGYVTAGDPRHIFSLDIHSSPIKDTRILARDREIPGTWLPSTAQTSTTVPADGGVVHFKHPNI